MSKKMQKESLKSGSGAKAVSKAAAMAGAASASTELMPGDPAPSFSLPGDDGRSISLADFTGRKLVVFFYPRAGTPGCTIEATDFSGLAPNFAAANTALLGVSADPLKALERFRKKHLLEIPLATDEVHNVLTSYGVWEKKSMYGKVFEGVVRTTFLIGEKGVIQKIWRKAKVDGHAREVLAAANASAARPFPEN
jgi:peroxiredoxin Q/BCP